MRSAVRRLALVLVVVGAGLAPAPATAAGYCTGGGVSVVVDFGPLGGGIQTGCDASGNRNAAKAFTNTGHPLTYAQRQPGFVCRVDGVPQSDPCVNTSPADAYWGLYWSDGTSGWKYSTLGVGSLTVPAGGTVAFSWQNGGTADPPGTSPAKPPAPVASPRPTSQPTTARPTRSPSPTSKSTSAASATVPPVASPSATAAATTPAEATTSPSPSASATSADPSAPVADGETTGPLDAATPASDDGLPWWLPVGSILALAVLGGVVVRVRRTRS